MLYKKCLSRGKAGFTIVELMIAISVFSAASTMILVGVLYISKQYQQATNRVALEEASRSFHAQALQSLQYTNRAAEQTSDGGFQAVCLGNQMYVYGSQNFGSLTTAGERLSAYGIQQPGLYVLNNISDCSLGSFNPSDHVNVLPENAKVYELQIDDVVGSIKTTFIKSDSDLLDLSDSSPTCSAAVSGREWCAVVSYESLGKRRIK